MPLVQTRVTSDEIQEATKDNDLYNKTWDGLQNAAGPKEADQVVYNHLDALEEALGKEIPWEKFNGPVEDRFDQLDEEVTEEDGRIQQIDFYVHVADHKHPIPLLYYDYDLKTNEALGGDLDLY